MKKAFCSWMLVAVLTLSACMASPDTIILPTQTAISTVPSVTSPASLAPTPTAASIQSINILYSSGPENAAVVGGNISLFQTRGYKTLPVVLGKGNFICWIPSPDGSKVLYVPVYYFSPLNDFVNVIDFRTGQVRRTVWRSANRCVGLIWHPSGEAFLGWNYECNQLELYRPDNPVPLAAIGETGLPAFSPDGKRLAILIGPDIHFYDIVLDVAGQVASVRQDYTNLSLPADLIGLMDFRWSPDGTEIAILAQRIGNAGGGPNPTELYVFNLADQSLVKMADSKELQPGINMEILPGFAWSPDGSKIAFSANTHTEAAGMEYYSTLPQVFVTGADSSGLVEITTDPGEVGEVVQWSPDGTKLIFVAGSERASPQDVPVYIHDHLAMSNPDGSEKIVLPIQNFFVLEGPIIDAPFMVLPPDSELPDLLKEPIHLNCASGWTQLESGSEAVVAPGDPNRVRSEPKKGDNLIAEILTGTVIKVLRGPFCADGLVFWRVQSDSIPGGQGWTAEGDGNEYYLEPIQ
jgi:hypothetical protein